MNRQLLEFLYVNPSSCNFKAPSLLKSVRAPTALSLLQHLKGFVVGPAPSLLVKGRNSVTPEPSLGGKTMERMQRSLQVKVNWESRGAPREHSLEGGSQKVP